MQPVYILRRLFWQQCGGWVGGIAKMIRHSSNSAEDNDGGLQQRQCGMTETEVRPF